MIKNKSLPRQKTYGYNVTVESREIKETNMSKLVNVEDDTKDEISVQRNCNVSAQISSPTPSMKNKNISSFQKMNDYVVNSSNTVPTFKPLQQNKKPKQELSQNEMNEELYDDSSTSTTAFDDSCWKSSESPDDFKKKSTLSGSKKLQNNTISDEIEDTIYLDSTVLDDDEKITSPKLNHNVDDIGIHENDSQVKVRNTVNHTEMKQDLSKDNAVDWSIALRTPRTSELFSPSIDMNKSSSLHGIGLTLTVDRSKQIIKCQTRLSKFLSNVAELSDLSGQTIVRFCQIHSSSISSNSSAIAISALLNELLSSILSFGKETQKSAFAIKGGIARPLHLNVGKRFEILKPIIDEYVSSREQCTKARSKALKQKKLYLKAVKEAEYAVKELEKAKAYNDSKSKSSSKSSTIATTSSLENESSTSSIPCADENETLEDGSSRVTAQTTAKSTKSKRSLMRKSERTLQALRVVQSSEKEYRAFVNKENDAVTLADKTESTALKNLQKTEKDRLTFLYESYIRFIESEIGALDNMSISFRRHSVSGSPSMKKREVISPPIPSPTTLFTKLLNFTDDSGVSEALSLGLPKEAGEARDQIKATLDAQSHYSLAIKIISNLVDEFADAVEDFSSNLVSRLASEGYTNQPTKNENLISLFMPQVEGSSAMNCWTEIIESLIKCANSASELSKNLRENNDKFLDKLLPKSEKDMRVITESEEMKWKNLCETGKSETKAKLKQDQAYAELLRAKERLNYCIENPGNGNEDDVGEKVNIAMRKAFGNMFSILPNKGEDAFSKMLNPQSSQARQAIAVKTCDEAEIKYQKENEIYKSLNKDLEMTISSYVSSSRSTIQNLKKKEHKVRSKIESSIDCTLDLMQNYRVERYTSLKPAIMHLKEGRHLGIKGDMNNWTSVVDEKFSQHMEKIKSNNNVTSGDDDNSMNNSTMKNRESLNLTNLSLQMEKVEAPRVYALISFLENDVSKAKENNESEQRSSDTDSHSDTKETLIGGQSSEVDTSNTEKKSQSTRSDVNSISERSVMTDDGEVPEKPESNSQSSIELSSLALLLKEAIENERRSLEDAQSGELSIPTSRATSAETEIFLQHFQEDESTEPPTLIGSYSCAYHPKEDSGSPYYLLHGRMFATPASMYFVGWGETKVIVPWKDIVSVKKEANVMGVVNNSLRIIANHGQGEKSYYFGSFAFREHCYQTVNKLVAVSKSIKGIAELEDKQDNGLKEETKKNSNHEMKKNLPPVPPDQTLKKMETVFSEKLKNVSVKKFYDLCIAETLDPFYGPFLEKEGNKDLNIGDWETAENELTNGWCGEKYAKKRVIKYNFTRTSHLYIGPPIASVTETQYCRIEGNDKCVLGTNVAMQGIPYADTFNVEVRLVARRNGSKDLSVDIGLFVDFKKSTLLKSKIRSGTIDETTSLKLKLFRAMKEVCYEGEKDIDESDDNETDEHVEDEILPPLNKINASNGKGLDMELIQKYLKVIASNLPSMEQVRSFMMSLDHTSIFVCFLLVLVAYLWTASQKSNTLTNEITLRKSDLINIEGKMDEFIVEMRETRKALQEIVLIMKEREPQA